MKQLCLTFAAVILGGVVLLAIPFIILNALVTVAMSSADTEIKAGTFLKIDLSDPISDRDMDTPAHRVRGYMSGDNSTEHGLNTLRDKLTLAAEDENVTGLMITGTDATANFANLRDLRRAIVEFKTACGKPVYYFGSSMGNGAAYVASAADSIFVAPEGSVLLTGCTSSKLYFKRLADKYGLGFDVIKHGKYKSAVEPYFRDSMSDEDREQTMRLITVLWDEMRDTIASARGIAPGAIDDYVDNLKGLSGNVEAAQKLGLIDRGAYYDEFQNTLRAASGIKDDENGDIVNVFDYKADNDAEMLPTSGVDKIAVVYACGQIYDGKSAGDDANIYGDDLAATLRELRKNSDVKAVVMRVNSPGGSALASDLIWREVKMLKAEKTVVVSMGGYAASGGYYISCAADHIVAEPNTITGSIGVFGMIPNAGKLADNMGVSFDVVSSSKNPIVTGIKPLSEPVLNALTNSVETTYNTFVSRVSDGRGLSFEAVDSIGGGRVWAGADALSNGLVDQLGNLDDAIDYAVEQSCVGDDFKVEAYPKLDDSMTAIMKQMGLSVRAGIGNALLGAEFNQVEKMRERLKTPEGLVWAVCDLRAE